MFQADRCFVLEYLGAKSYFQKQLYIKTEQKIIIK